MFLVTWWLFFLFLSVSVQAARDGDVRLADSNRYGTGRVEVFYDGSWGTICDRGWDLDDAEVICRQLNFPNGAQRSFYGARFGEGRGRVLLSEVKCVGDENNLLECDNVQNNWAMNDCQHALDVGVQCSAPNYEGCFQIRFLRASEGFQADEMTIETCFEVCAPGGFRYFWLHNGRSCDCGNSIEATAKVDNNECVTDCPGNFDQRCGGRDLASVYKVEVDLPFVASPGFPGRFISTGDPLVTSNFDPQGAASYSFIQFHQLDLPTLANLSVSSNGRTDMFQGGIGTNEYWIASANSPIQVSFQLPEGNIESVGFLLEFGEGSYCPAVTIVSNGRLSTAESIPYTAGTEIRVMCNSGFMAYDDTVFCQADGSFNRDIMCVPGGPTTVRSTRQQQQTTQQPTQNLRTTLPSPPPTQQLQPVITNSITIIISVSQKEYTAEEGDTITVSFTTNEPASENIEIDLNTLDSSHASQLGPLDNAVIRDGESSGAVEIQILEDTFFDGVQTVMVSFVSLTTGAGIAFGDETISITIMDTTPERNCLVPVIENGEHNSSAEILSPGDKIMVTCSFPYKAAEDIVTCQMNGDFTPSAECVPDLLIIIVIGVSGLIFILIVVLLVILICCLCYYRRKKRRRVSSHERRNEQANLRGPYGGPPPLSRNDGPDNEEIFALPDDDGLPAYSGTALSAPSSSSPYAPQSPPVHPPNAGPTSPLSAPPTSTEGDSTGISS